MAYQPLSWKDVSVNFNDANSAMASGLSSVSKAGDIFNKLSDQIHKEEQDALELDYKNRALEQADRIAANDLAFKYTDLDERRTNNKENLRLTEQRDKWKHETDEMSAKAQQTSANAATMSARAAMINANAHSSSVEGENKERALRIQKGQEELDYQHKANEIWANVDKDAAEKDAAAVQAKTVHEDFIKNNPILTDITNRDTALENLKGQIKSLQADVDNGNYDQADENSIRAFEDKQTKLLTLQKQFKDEYAKLEADKKNPTYIDLKSREEILHKNRNDAEVLANAGHTAIGKRAIAEDQARKLGVPIKYLGDLTPGTAEGQITTQEMAKAKAKDDQIIKNEAKMYEPDIDAVYKRLGLNFKGDNDKTNFSLLVMAALRDTNFKVPLDRVAEAMATVFEPENNEWFSFDTNVSSYANKYKYQKAIRDLKGIALKN